MWDPEIMVEICYVFFSLQKQVEFLVEYADTEKAASKPVNFNVTPETLQNIREVSAPSLSFGVNTS